MSAGGGPGADAVTGPGPVTVEIEDICGPATFDRLPEALAATREALRLLPLGAVQADAFRYFLAHPEVDRLVRESIRREGRLSLAFRPGGRVHCVRIGPAGTPPPP
ncbi:hypothetical protein OG689_11545 [Kitasatospora sp. NBC_00240]|uniref:hypothetical protein n=1 Tax=Kitasatospora sp. NBC_00240 TaxID=2903567 RepID=UPI002255EC52|nr:hypothetical protein [Kitasatospora sp. NBC_00240]MCX5209918.1 hypothetical protein [Kitasatospora sp. NBC_00240]